MFINSPLNNRLYDFTVSANDKDQPYATNGLCKQGAPKQWQGAQPQPPIRECECMIEKQVLSTESFPGNGLLVDVAIPPTSRSTNDLTKTCCISECRAVEKPSICCYHPSYLPIDSLVLLEDNTSYLPYTAYLSSTNNCFPHLTAIRS